MKTLIKALKEITAIHTSTPSTSKRADFSHYGTYANAVKLLPSATSYKLENLSNFGAEVWLGFGRETEPVQLTKKKIRYSDIVLELFDINPFTDPQGNKEMCKELMKHGIILIR